MPDDYPIFLVGPMGSGKTAVGQRLAQLLERQFVDTDREIEKRCGVDVAFIFDKEGEAGFRTREHRALADLAALPAMVVATGGGIVTRDVNRKILRETGVVVYLETSVNQQYERTRYSSTRPLLHGDDPKSKLQELMAVRGPLYASVADITCSTDGQRVNQVAKQVCAMLESFALKKKNRSCSR